MADPLILISNDDGVDAAGLKALTTALETLGEVWVVAPDGERSTSSHSFTLDRSVAVRAVSERVFSVGGWPADCVYIALFGLLPRRPSVVVSGINRGANLGTDVLYSGTVAAAREAHTRGVPAVASSLVEGDDFGLAAWCTARLVRAVLAAETDPPLLLNVNVPGPTAAGARVTRLGRRFYPEEAVLQRRESGLSWYRLGVGPVRDALLPGSDGEAIEAGFVSVTPLQVDTTALEARAAAELVATRAWEGSPELW